MLPRAAIVDPSRLAVLRPLAWWRTPRPWVFLAGHCATAGALQLGALLIDLSRAGRPSLGVAALAWVWGALVILAAIPAAACTLIELLRRRPGTRRERLLEAAGVGAVYYGALPLAVTGGAVGPAIATLVTVAVAWHVAIALGPPLRLFDGARPT